MSETKMEYRQLIIKDSPYQDMVGKTLTLNRPVKTDVMWAVMSDDGMTIIPGTTWQGRVDGEFAGIITDDEIAYALRAGTMDYTILRKWR